MPTWQQYLRREAKRRIIPATLTCIGLWSELERLTHTLAIFSLHGKLYSIPFPNVFNSQSRWIPHGITFVEWGKILHNNVDITLTLLPIALNLLLRNTEHWENDIYKMWTGGATARWRSRNLRERWTPERCLCSSLFFSSRGRVIMGMR